MSSDLPELLGRQLEQSLDALLRASGASSARIWTADATGSVFELRASASLGAQAGATHQTCRPLVAGGREVGAITLAAAAPLSDATLRWLEAIAVPIALAIASSASLAEVSRFAAVQIEHDSEELRDLAESLEQRVGQRTAELRRSNQELEAFSYSVSHDLRAPIRHISGFADLLERHCADQLDARGAHYLKTIAVAARQAGQLVDDLLAFSKMGRAEMVLKDVDLNDIVASCRREVIADEGGRQVEWAIARLPTVKADAALIRQVLRNLLSNAMKYTRRQSRPRIEVGTAAHGEMVTVFVKDNGVGFDMQHVSKLFGVFQRLHRSDEFEGTGIGLANVRRIIERHGGETRAEGQLGEGATFSFSLPVPTVPSAP